MKFILLLALLLCSHILEAQQTQQQITAILVKKLVSRHRVDLPLGSTPFHWTEAVNRVFTEALTLEAQQAFRESQKIMTGRILADLRASWFGRFRGETVREVASLSEQRAAQNLERFYKQLGETFESPNTLFEYVEREGLLGKGLISENEYLFIRLFRGKERVVDPRASFRSLRELRIGQLKKEIDDILEKGHKGGRPIEETLEKITLVFRNLSEHNQFLWTYAEAKFSLKLQYSFWYLWTNHFSRVPHLKTRWLRFWKRWSLEKRIKIPTSTPLDDIELANFFIEFTRLFADSLAYPTPRSIAILPWNYIRRAVEKHARILSADFEIMEGLKDISPEIREALEAKASVASSLLKMEELFDSAQGPGMPGFEALLETIRKEGEGNLEKGIIHLLTPIEGGYNPFKSSARISHWIGNNLFFTFMIITSIRGNTEDEIPAPPIYPADRENPFSQAFDNYDELITGHPKGEAPKPMLDIHLEVIIQEVEKDIQVLKEELMEIDKNSSEYQKKEAEIKSLQHEIEKLYQLNPELKQTQSP